jgi:NAD(P)-dependent dehydrogenase (short-subunit alcohol dehydrogenase family)
MKSFSGAVSIAAVSNVYDCHHAGLVVDTVDHPVGTAPDAESVVIAERYARLGADIVVNYATDSTAACATVARIHDLGTRAIAVQADVAKVDDVRHLFETAQSAFGKIDIAVANAGLELTGLPVSDFTEEQYDRMFAVNAIVPTATEGAGLHANVKDGSPIKKFAAGFIPMGRMGTPDDIANVAEFFASDLSGFVSGQLLLVNGGGLA